MRQSLFPAGERPAVYALFEKYLAFLKEQRLYDPNILSHRYLELMRPSFDLVVADEVQDITNIQLRLILSSLTEAGQFILCGDSNQIVHPNFFSWASLKSMLYREEAEEGPERVYRILHANFRNAATVTDLANRLLRIKHQRFGSVDRESTYLMECMPGEPGEVVFLEDVDAVKADLNRRTGQSTHFAVIVMREEDKETARAFFRTPLLFSVHEAKGLEYENVILLNFISGQRAWFEEIARGIDAADLDGELAYGRGKDKADKSLEIFKFYVNALYVAITRAIRRVYVIESNGEHPMARLLGFGATGTAASVATQQSSREEWQAEARKLELQGKKEQAEEIRQRILHVTPVPREVLDTARLLALLDRALDSRDVSQKPRKALLDYALTAGEPGILERLHRIDFDRVAHFFSRPEMQHGPDGRHQVIRFDRELYVEQSAAAQTRASKSFLGANFKGVLADCERYGVDHRSPVNQTPLMTAASVGNLKLVRALLDAGADPAVVDNYGRTAWHFGILRSFSDEHYAAEIFPELHEMLVPPGISVRVDDRLVKIDNHTGEFLLFSIFSLGLEILRKSIEPGLTAIRIEGALGRLPDAVAPPYRKKRSYISSLLAKNEIECGQPYNRKLFRRIRHGH